jgi:hypothetical protein
MSNRRKLKPPKTKIARQNRIPRPKQVPFQERLRQATHDRRDRVGDLDG